jgi:ATP-dependent exoDNAse (exonuclease V) alpha subunit
MDHLIVDEASMLPATDMARLLMWAIDTGVGVTLIGDWKQLNAIGPVALLRRMHDFRGGVELTENLRQKTATGRECAAFLREGNAHDALQLLAAAGQFHVARSEVEKNPCSPRHGWPTRGGSPIPGSGCA